MAQKQTAEAIRAARKEDPKSRDRDFADRLGISEAQLVAAHLGVGVRAITPDPDRLMPAVSRLGEVMALTRNQSAIHERVGTYGEYHSGAHAAMVLGKEIDLRIFPKHWATAFAIEQETEKGLRRTLQVFDAAGDAVHKVFLREESNHDAWAEVIEALAVEGSESLEVADRVPPEAAKQNPAKRDLLLSEWAKMTDTHQFMRLTSKLGINRLGAYRMVSSERWVKPLDLSAPAMLLDAVAQAGQEVILFVGNRGMIQIHWGRLVNIKPMGPWLNVLDDRFDLHLRSDHIAEVYAVIKPTKRGAALSIEMFDAAGMLIAQVFGQRSGEDDDLSDWNAIISALPTASMETA
ncbi:hemin-degrading factor [Cognatiyoonia sp. IB215182]|uniref:hemin-degrading factor n=1 Tax=Cognatiyoonia sp. IB215182 TaxID=3097353 RepID=UPI002A17EE3B|nr:ChuX/HutX family heme-like substrate-binding protein [Cognatiyoonia sp. IB215182]MDX8355255.1 ChuX/HutX family heme-like substrate-binding protein [Cognatiyoonia sp. IB215182]